jgi:hypothetical protein
LQSYKLDELSDYLSNNTIDDNGYYNGRKQLLANIETTDQRSAWFNGEEDYSFNAAETTLAGKYYPLNHEYRNYLFFKNNLLNTDKYESLDKYIGYYTYNGKVSENSDGTYSLVPNKLTIDGMLEEFANYIDFVLGSKSVSYSTDANYEANSTTTNYYTDSTKSEIDYSKFVYASGKVDFGGENRNTMFVKDSAQYLAMAAVNELQYAYTTDTSVLSQYVGYTVSAYSTSFIKEFEYAAQEAVKNGAGSFNVCAGDYGWHLIYVTQTFDVEGGAVYGEELKWDLESIQKEGTFQNMFYEWVKDSLLSNITTTKRSTIIEMFGGDTTITKNEDTYQDLLELDS